jgi:hypothetical protein
MNATTPRRAPAEPPPLLPGLDDTAPASDAAPKWKHVGIEALGGFAGAMRVDRREVPPHRIHSVPSPWARALLFEQALFTPNHPAGPGVKSEWRGLLGVIALGHMLPLELRVARVELPTRSSDADENAMADLRAMAPGTAQWEKLALVYSGNELVGATSPYTLMFTGARPVKAPIPFRSPQGRLVDPGQWYAEVRRDPDVVAALAAWISTTRAALNVRMGALVQWMGSRPAGPTAQALDRAGRTIFLLDEWSADVDARLKSLGAGRATVTTLLPSPFAKLTDVFPPHQPSGEVYGVLQPLPGGQFKENQLRFKGEAGYRDVVLDPRRSGVVFGGDGQPYRGPLALEQGFPVHVQGGRLPDDVGASQIGSPLLDAAAFFEPRLIGIAGPSPRVHTLPGGYLLPFRREILEWFTPAQVMRFASLSGDRQTGFEVHFSVPLAEGLSVRWSRSYAPTAVDGADRWPTPRLAVWPDFVADRWTHYFYVTRLTAADDASNLRLHPIAERVRPADREAEGGVAAPPAEPAGRYADQKTGVTWEEWTRPLAGWQATAGEHQGLLLARAVAETHMREGQRWAVSIDFGSTHSRAFRSEPGAASLDAVSPVPLKARAASLLGDEPLPVLFFLPPSLAVSQEGEEEVQTIVRFPLAVAVPSTGAAWLPSDGILFRRALFGLAALEGLNTRLKWHERPEDEKAFEAAISHLYLAVAAEAAAEGATVESVRVAYPSVFTGNLQARHRRMWELLAHRYGFTLLAPAAESEALQRFTAASHGDMGGGTGLLAVDIGGSTSDLALWTREGSTAFSSVRLAGSLVGSLVASDTAVRDVVENAGRHLLNKHFAGWNDSQGVTAAQRAEVIRLGFDELLRTLSRTGPSYSTVDLALAVENDPAGRRLIAHAGYLYAVVAYLLGLMARRTKMADLPHFDLHFAGHGSQFIRWLDVLTEGGSQEIPRAFFLAGLAAPGTRTVMIHAPARAKEEVGRGLLLFEGNEQPAAITRDTFVGETGFGPEETPLPWYHRVKAEEVPDLLATGVPELDRMELLRQFMNTFQTSVATRALARALGIVPGAEGNKGRLHNRIRDRLHMPRSAWATAGNPTMDPSRARLEPIVVVGAKALLEVATGNSLLFDES